MNNVNNELAGVYQANSEEFKNNALLHKKEPFKKIFELNQDIVASNYIDVELGTYKIVWTRKITAEIATSILSSNMNFHIERLFILLNKKGELFISKKVIVRDKDDNLGRGLYCNKTSFSFKGGGKTYKLAFDTLETNHDNYGNFTICPIKIRGDKIISSGKYFALMTPIEKAIIQRKQKEVIQKWKNTPNKKIE